MEVVRRGVVSLIQYQHSQGTCTVRAAAPVTAPISILPYGLHRMRTLDIKGTFAQRFSLVGDLYVG